MREAAAQGDFGNGIVVAQQRLSPFLSQPHKITMWRHAIGCLEAAREMTGAKTRTAAICARLIGSARWTCSPAAAHAGPLQNPVGLLDRERGSEAWHSTPPVTS